ncbi:zinc-ribbon domain-containing protein [Aquimarina sediminis]|uniref:zinc-ribbon domain-containing protein n=1 Tax=Aquimarina sediminis TaxID=2070536 RepID=UPI000CA0456C|nr:zinc-ribbon domain-containing protein [Aquimarina sediminis]
MIIFGTSSSTIHPKQLREGDCPYCKTENNMWIQGYRKYVHVFWIPFFPIGKKVYSVCGHCKGAFERNEMKSQKLIESFEESKNTYIKTPWYHFTGLILLISSIALLTILPYLR